MTQQHAYRKATWKPALALQDFFLVLVLVLLWVLEPRGPLAVALAAAVPATVAWSVLTLHFPSKVEIDVTGIAFSAYGRVHRFAWNDIEQIHVRRFVVRDRVLVRIVPASVFRGRYWLLDSIEDYGSLIRTLEQGCPCRSRT